MCEKSAASCHITSGFLQAFYINMLILFISTFLFKKNSSHPAFILSACYLYFLKNISEFHKTLWLMYSLKYLYQIRHV